VWRSGCGTCGHGIIVRGVPEPLGSGNRWHEGYAFYIDRGGSFSVVKFENGALTVLQAWTSTPAIIPGDAWNILRVVAEGPDLQFYINGTAVWSGSDPSFSSGRVGLLMYRTPSSIGDLLRVDWARLTSIGTWVTCSTPDLSIPDDDPAGVFDEIVLLSFDYIADLDVFVDVAHTWVGDLVVTVEKMGLGPGATIIHRPGYPAATYGCSGDDIAAILDDEAETNVEHECEASVPTIWGSFIPTYPLSAFDVTPVEGIWRLTISDNDGGFDGTLNEWCLVFSTKFHTYLPVVRRGP
jgi:hypothetical protein